MLHSSPAVILTGLLAAAPDPTAPVKDYFEMRNTQKAQSLRRALHPSMNMFWSSEGQQKVLSAEAWLNRVSMPTLAPKPDVKPKPDANQAIALTLVDGEIGVVKTAIDNPDGGYRDYLGLVKLGGRYWIIAKVFHRRDVSKPESLAVKDMAVERTAIDALLGKMFSAFERQEGLTLAGAFHPRAMFFGVQSDQLVAQSIADASARLDDDKSAKSVIANVKRTIVSVDVEPTAALATLERSFEDGQKRRDFALLTKTNEGWKIVSFLHGSH